MGDRLNRKDPTWANWLLLAASFLCLALVLALAYRGWREDHILHPTGHGGHSGVIADISVNLGGVTHQEHCLTCHPQGKAAKISGRDLILGKDHPSIAPHSTDDLGCTGCHLGEGMARDLVISHGRLGNEAQKVMAGKELQATCYRCHELKGLCPFNSKAYPMLPEGRHSLRSRGSRGSKVGFMPSPSLFRFLSFTSLPRKRGMRIRRP